MRINDGGSRSPSSVNLRPVTTSPTTSPTPAVQQQKSAQAPSDGFASTTQSGGTSLASWADFKRSEAQAEASKPVSSLELMRRLRSVATTKFDGASAPVISQYAPDGKQTPSDYANGPSNCGPTTMAIIARACGKESALSNTELVEHMASAGETSGGGTTKEGIAAMAKTIGLRSTALGPEVSTSQRLAALDAAVSAGNPALVKGDYFSLPWRQDFTSAKSGKTGEANDPEGHYLTIVGKDARGQYLVRDPATPDTRVTPMSADQLGHFLEQNSRVGSSGQRGNPGMVYVLAP